MRTPVALPPILERMEQHMPERRRFTQTTSLEGRLADEAKRLRSARQAETASRMNEWLTSPGLQAPKQVQ